MSRALYISVGAMRAGRRAGLHPGAFQIKWAEDGPLLKARLLRLTGFLLAHGQAQEPCKMLIGTFLKQHSRVEASRQLGETTSAY